MGKSLSSTSSAPFCCSESSPRADLPMATLERLPRASRGRHTSTAAAYRHSQAVLERTRADLLRVTRHHVLPHIHLEEKNNLSSRDSVCNTPTRPALVGSVETCSSYEPTGTWRLPAPKEMMSRVCCCRKSDRLAKRMCVARFAERVPTPWILHTLWR
jgi:hypothetical protein